MRLKQTKEWRRNRYRHDPDYRLARINDRRVRRGAPPIACLSDVGRSLMDFAAKRQRNERGWFI